MKIWLATATATATATGKETETGMEMARQKIRIRHKKAYMSGEKIELEIEKHPVRTRKAPYIECPKIQIFVLSKTIKNEKTHPRTESEGWV